jgi:hypothetical protein
MLTLQRGNVATPDAFRQIALLQTLLVEIGLLAEIDGNFGSDTVAAIKTFQARNGLVVDGVAGEKTWSKLAATAPALFTKISSLWLSQADLDGAAASLNVDRAAIKAVYEIEAGGAGFLGLRPKILFEGHIFWRLLREKGRNPARYANGNEDILYENWTSKYYRGGLAEYARLNRALAIDDDAALKSASWGLFQILGNNYAAAGYADVNAFVEGMKASERDQLVAFTSFLTGTRFRGVQLRDLLAACDWAGFARAYNGPGYTKNQYDIKLQGAFDRIKVLVN